MFDRSVGKYDTSARLVDSAGRRDATDHAGPHQGIEGQRSAFSSPRQVGSKIVHIWQMNLRCLLASLTM